MGKFARDKRPNSLYEHVAGDSCIYCGVEAEVLDHAYPKSREPTLAPPGMMLLVPSCRQCNALAGDEVHRTINERREFIHRKLRKRNQALLATPEWEDWELGRLKGRLRESVLNALEAQHRLSLRLAYRPDSHDDQDGDDFIEDAPYG